METKPRVRKVQEVHVYNSPDRTRESREITELSRKLYYRFVEANKAVSARPCYNWVRLSQSSKYNKIDGRFKEFLDHGTLLTSENDKILVTQPYYFSISEVEEWANKRGLSVETDKNNSWYYPTRTTLLIFKIRDNDLFETYIDNNIKESILGNGMQEVD